jgi:hypothetical protein
MAAKARGPCRCQIRPNRPHWRPCSTLAPTAEHHHNVLLIGCALGAFEIFTPNWFSGGYGLATSSPYFQKAGVVISHGMDDDYLYDAYAGHEKTNFSRTEFESEFLTFPNGCSASGGALAGDRPAVTVRCDGEECRSCKPNAVLQALADGSEASTYPLLLYASSARRIRRAFGHDEHDILPHLKKMLDLAKPTVLVSLPNMAWGSTSREFWVYDALYAQLGQLKSNFNVMVRAHPLDTIVPGLLPGFDVTAMVWSWPLVEMADIVVGRPNGVVCSATHVPDKTLVVVSDYPKAA